MSSHCTFLLTFLCQLICKSVFVKAQFLYQLFNIKNHLNHLTTSFIITTSFVTSPLPSLPNHFLQHRTSSFITTPLPSLHHHFLYNLNTAPLPSLLHHFLYYLTTPSLPHHFLRYLTTSFITSPLPSLTYHFLHYHTIFIIASPLPLSHHHFLATSFITSPLPSIPHNFFNTLPLVFYHITSAPLPSSKFRTT